MALSNRQFDTVFIDFDNTLYRYHSYNLIMSYKKVFQLSEIDVEEMWRFFQLSNDNLAKISAFAKNNNMMCSIDNFSNILKQCHKTDSLSNDDQKWIEQITKLYKESSIWKSTINHLLQFNFPLLSFSGKVNEWPVFINKHATSNLCIVSFTNIEEIPKKFIEHNKLMASNNMPFSIRAWLPRQRDTGKLVHMLSYFHDKGLIKTDREDFLTLSSLLDVKNRGQKSFVEVCECIKSLSQDAKESIYHLFSNSILIDDSQENIDCMINFLKMLSNDLNIAPQNYATTNVLLYTDNIVLESTFNSCMNNLQEMKYEKIAKPIEENLSGWGEGPDDESKPTPTYSGFGTFESNNNNNNSAPISVDETYYKKSLEPFLREKKNRYQSFTPKDLKNELMEDLEEKLKNDKRVGDVEEIVSQFLGAQKSDFESLTEGRFKKK